MLDWIIEKNAIDVVEMQLFRLAIEQSDLEQWIMSAKKIDNFLESFLGSDPKIFWSTLVHRKKMVDLLESCLDFYIKTSYFNELEFYMRLRGGEVFILFLRIYQRVFLIFLRMLTNLETEGIVDVIFGHVIYTNKIVTIDILVKLCSIYGSENEAILSSLINKLLTIQVGFKRDLDCFVSSACQVLEKSRKDIAQIVGDVENNRLKRDVSHTDQLLRAIDIVSNLFLSLSSFVEVYQPKELWKNLYIGIPRFIDNISKTLTDVNIMNLAVSTLSVPFANLLACKRARINQTGVHLFKTFYRLKALGDRDRFRMIFDNLSCKDFLVRLDDDINIKEELSKFLKSKVCSKDHERYIVKALDEAYSDKAHTVKAALVERRILQNIGKLKNTQISKAVQCLEDLLPNFTREQFHLCLRHFDYDLEKTTNAIIEMKDKLPLELKILMRKRENFKDVNPARVYIHQFWDNGKMEASGLGLELAQPVEINSLFNLNPTPETKLVEKKAESDKERNKKLERLMMKYDGLFDMSGVQTVLSSIDKAKQTGALKAEAIEMNGKLLVKQNAIQRELQQPSVTADEKAAIRETYNRYQYELSEDDDEDGRLDLDARYAEEVGVSGRFNQQNKKSVVFAQVAVQDDDEYDDTYDDPGTFAGDVARSENESEEEISKQAALKQQQKTVTSNYSQSFGSANFSKSNQTNQHPKGRTVNPLFRGGNSAGSSSRKSKTSAASAATNRHEANTNNHSYVQNSSTSYTGGRSRQVKEKNKGKMQQRGADRKARGGMI